jgi:hypothetical protein
MVSTQEAYRKVGWWDESLFSCLPEQLESCFQRVSLNFGRSAASFRLTASTVKSLRWRNYPDKPYLKKLMEHDYVLGL